MRRNAVEIGEKTFHHDVDELMAALKQRRPEPGKAPSPGPMTVPSGELRKFLGISEVNFIKVNQPLAIVDNNHHLL